MLTQTQIDSYHKHGFLRIPHLFTPEETAELSEELDRLVEDWAFTNPGWSGPWRQAYMDPETEKRSKLTAMQDLHYYSVAWMRAATNPKLAEALSDLLGPQCRAAPYHPPHQTSADRASIPTAPGQPVLSTSGWSLH